MNKLTQDSVVLILSELPGETTVWNVVQVLQPLEVGDCDTTSVEVQIGNDQALLVKEDLVSGGGDWAVGTLGDDLSLKMVRKCSKICLFYLDVLGVVSGDDLLLGTGAENVALLLDEWSLWGVPGLGAREANNGAVLKFPLLKGLDINALWVVQVTVVLGDTDTLGSHTAEVTGGVETDITETLHDESLVFPAEWKTNHLHVFWSVQENVGTVEDTATSGRDAAVNTTCNGLISENSETRLPCEMGLPVTQAGAFKSMGLSLAYSLAIQAISRSPKYQLCN